MSVCNGLVGLEVKAGRHFCVETESESATKVEVHELTESEKWWRARVLYSKSERGGGRGGRGKENERD